MASAVSTRVPVSALSSLLCCHRASVRAFQRYNPLRIISPKITASAMMLINISISLPARALIPCWDTAILARPTIHWCDSVMDSDTASNRLVPRANDRFCRFSCLNSPISRVDDSTLTSNALQRESELAAMDLLSSKVFRKDFASVGSSRTAPPSCPSCDSYVITFFSALTMQA